MRIRAIQTGTLAIKQRQLRARGTGRRRRLSLLLDRSWTAPLPIYAWLVEHPEGLIVIDTGETSQAAESFTPGLRESVRPDEEIGMRLQAVRINPHDVRWVILTHLHMDHCDGLHYFPRAQVLVSKREVDERRGPSGQVAGYHSAALPRTRPVAFADGPVGPFPASETLTRAGDVVLIPTPGHTAGHLSVIVRDGDTSLFFAGDATYSEELLIERALDGSAVDEAAWYQTVDRILDYAHEQPTVYLPAHDPKAAQRLAARATVRVEAVVS
jgi:glyoxylase-like metal-dependent hydrolase (beta-lactamase superfamily II)